MKKITECSDRRNGEWANDHEKPLPSHRHNTYVNYHGDIHDVIQRANAAYITCSTCVHRLRAGQGEHSSQKILVVFSVAFPTIIYEKTKSTTALIRHMNAYHSQDSLWWAIKKQRDLLQLIRKAESVPADSMDVQNCILAFVCLLVSNAKTSTCFAGDIQLLAVSMLGRHESTTLATSTQQNRRTVDAAACPRVVAASAIRQC